MSLYGSDTSSFFQKLEEESGVKCGKWDIYTQYEIQRCNSWIKSNGFKSVCLQFPDELLCDAFSVSSILKSEIKFDVYILADNTFGSCCIDEITAEHVGADSIIHFGRTCLSSTKRLPVLYIFTCLEVNVDAVISVLESSSSLNFWVVLYDTRCSHVIDEMQKRLEDAPHIIFSELIIPSNDSTSEEVKVLPSTLKDYFYVCNRKFKIKDGMILKNIKFYYVGPNTSTLTCLAMYFSENSFVQINPLNGSITEHIGYKSVLARSGKLELIKDARTIGILVGTLGVSDYTLVIEQLHNLIKYSGKKAYTFVAGKPNEAKLANFGNIDVFVYVSCPEMSVIQRDKDPYLYRRIVTPWEVQIALHTDQEWSICFESDFRQLLPGGNLFKELPTILREEDGNVSLLSNQMQTLGIRESQKNELSVSGTISTVDDKSLVLASQDNESLGPFSWRGLDPSYKSDAPLGTIIKGKKGVASAYEDEASER